MTAGITWIVVGVSRTAGLWALVLVVPALISRRRLVILVVVAGLVSGLASSAREAGTLNAELPPGRVTVIGRMVDDARSYGSVLQARIDPTHLLTRSGWTPWLGPRLAVTLTDPPIAVAGEHVTVTGQMRARSRLVRGDPVAGTIEGATVERLAGPPSPLFRAGNAIRRRVRDVLDGTGPRGALLAGFLVGDVDRLPADDVDNLRLAGLSHFVAVSGSNVALFLAAWFVAAGPLGWGPRRRAAIGLLGLALFVVVTRWEPSVVRAALMAALVLVGRVGGIALTPWAALGTAVSVSLLVAGHLSFDVGFQLSVAATSGVLLGSRLISRLGWGLAGQGLGITLGAQVAVAPLLLWHFGQVPLLSPVTNLLAAPIVTLATATGGAAILTGWAVPVALATRLAGVVLTISEQAAGWPQLDATGVGLVAGMIGVARFRSLRPLVTLAASLALVAWMLPAGPVRVPTLVFLDVGQGDATLLLDPAGSTVLVDGGPDPARLLAKLREYDVDHIDLLVATHGDQDHIGGIPAVLDSYPVGRLWHPGHAEGSDLYESLLDQAEDRNVLIDQPRAGWTADVGSFRIDVLGPARRYAGVNDESLVLGIESAGVTALLTGDIEAAAQNELGVVTVDILKVPHHGAATTDLAWLRRYSPSVVIISVGPNTFGHPHSTVLAVLDGLGADVRRTDLLGDIVIPVGG